MTAFRRSGINSAVHAAWDVASCQGSVWSESGVLLSGFGAARGKRGRVRVLADRWPFLRPLQDGAVVRRWKAIGQFDFGCSLEAMYATKATKAFHDAPLSTLPPTPRGVVFQEVARRVYESHVGLSSFTGFVLWPCLDICGLRVSCRRSPLHHA